MRSSHISSSVTYLIVVMMSWHRNAFRIHDDVIEWKHFPRYWPFVRGIHRWPVNSPHKGQWRWVLMFSLIFAWTNGWVNNQDASDLRRHCAHYCVIVMYSRHVLSGYDICTKALRWILLTQLKHGLVIKGKIFTNAQKEVRKVQGLHQNVSIHYVPHHIP